MDTLLELDIARYQNCLNELEVKIEEYRINKLKIDELEKILPYTQKNSSLASTITVCKESFKPLNLFYDETKAVNVNVEDNLEEAKKTGGGIWEKIKQLIQYIANFIKSIYVKILGMLGRYESRLASLQKDFNNILNKGEIELPNELWKTIYGYYPLLAKENNSNYPVEAINTHIMQILTTTIKPFGSIGDIGTGIFKIVEALKHNSDISVNVPSGSIGDAIKAAEGNTNLKFLLLTYIVKNELKFIGMNKDGGTEYGKSNIQAGDYKLPEKFIIKKLDIDAIIQKLQNDYIKNLKVFKQAMDKFKSELEQKTKEMANDNNKHPELANLIKISKSLPIDCTISLYKNLSLTIGILEATYKKCSSGNVDATSNYTVVAEAIKKSFPDTELKYLKGSKELPYIYSRELMDAIVATTGIAGGMVLVSGKDVSGIPPLKDISIPEGTDIESIIFIDEGFVTGKTAIKFEGGERRLKENLLEFCYYHEMGHAMLQQQEDRQAGLWKEFVGDFEKFNEEFKDVVDVLNKLQTTEELKKKLESDSKFKSRYSEYMKQSESNGIKRYLESYIEIQADCHAMLKLGMSLEALAKIRCEKLMPVLAPYKVQYKENIRKQLPYVKSMAKVSTIAQIKNFIKGNR